MIKRNKNNNSFKMFQKLSQNTVNTIYVIEWTGNWNRVYILLNNKITKHYGVKVILQSVAYMQSKRTWNILLSGIPKTSKALNILQPFYLDPSYQ